jgi:hypothetical protein
MSLPYLSKLQMLTCYKYSSLPLKSENYTSKRFITLVNKVQKGSYFCTRFFSTKTTQILFLHQPKHSGILYQAATGFIVMALSAFARIVLSVVIFGF